MIVFEIGTFEGLTAVIFAKNGEEGVEFLLWIFRNKRTCRALRKVMRIKVLIPHTSPGI